MKKAWNRLIAVSLSLMLMFTMGLNVFAAENVEGAPSDDPAVTLDEDGDAVTEAAEEAAVADEEEPVVEEDSAGDVQAMEVDPVTEGETFAAQDEPAVESEKIDLAIENKTGMFKADTAYLTTENDQEYLVMALSGTGYKELYKGIYEEAVANGDGTADRGNDTWIHYYENAAGKYEFKIPLNADDSFVPIVAVSDSYYTKYLNGQNDLARAFYPRQFTLDREAKTIVTNDYNETTDFTVTSNVGDFKVAATASTHVVGGPNSNGYAVEPTLVMENLTYDKVTYPTVVNGAISTAEATLKYRKFAIKMTNAPNKEAFKDKEPIEMTFHVSENAPYKEAGTNVVRIVTIDKVAKTIVIDGEALSPLPVTLEDGTYALPELAAGPSAMFNHFEENSKELVVSGDTATIRFITDASTTSIQKYSKIALGKSSELLETNYQETLPEGTTIIEGILQEDTPDVCRYLFEVPVTKAEAEALLSNTANDDIYIIVWNKEGSKQDKIPGWYKASDDIYLSLGGLADADYTAVDAALAKVPEDLSIYTEETADAVKDAVAAAVRGKKVNEQAEVDAMAQAIEDAVKALRVAKFEYNGTTVQFIKRDGEEFGMWSAMEGSTFTYSDGQIHISIIPSNTKKTYSWMHWGGINEELKKDVTLDEDGKIVLDLSTENCGWAVPVAPIKTKDDTATTSSQYYLAVPALESFTSDADYTAVEAALATVPEDLSIYTEETAAAVTEAVNAVVRNKKAVEQADVDRMADAIDQTVKALVGDLSFATIDAIPAQTYKGTALTPVPTVKLGDKTLVKDTDYTVTYANNINAGKATVTIQGNGSYSGEVTASFTINKADNTLSVSGKSVKIKKKAVKKKAQKLAATKVLTVRNAQGKVTYKGVGVNKKSKKALKINASNGQVTVKKKTKKGTYKMKVTVTAAGNGNYKAASVTRTITVKVK